MTATTNNNNIASNNSNNNVEIINVRGRRPVYCKYQGQYNAQPAYICLDMDERRLFADYISDSGYYVDSLSRKYWGIKSDISSKQLNALLAEIAPLANAAIAGYDGDELNLSARNALDEIDRRVSRYSTGY